MPIKILMPALSPTMEKGNLAKWLKKEGDAVKTGDIIAEIETDKATMEVEAIDDGMIAKIVVPQGAQDVPVNDLIAILAAEGEDVAAAARDAVSGGTISTRNPPQAAEAEKPTAKEVPSKPSIAEEAAFAAASSATTGSASTNAERTRVFASPLARRLAKEAGIDVARISGSGPRGRIIARDVEEARSGKGLKPVAAGPAAAPAPSDQQIRALFKDGSYEAVPHDNMRRIIAQRLVQAKQTIPHFYLTVDCNIDRLTAAREEINAGAPRDKDGKPAYRLSVNDFIIKALAVALQRVPDANVSWTETAMLRHKASDIGVAVAIPGGLITPVVRDAHIKPVSVISNEMKDYAARARNRRLKPEEYQGGSSAVSNLGMFGIKDFAAVINPPHATILAVGVGEQRPIVKNGKLDVATLMTVTLSTDHRAVDGALGAQLLDAFKMLIENPILMVV